MDGAGTGTDVAVDVVLVKELPAVRTEAAVLLLVVEVVVVLMALSIFVAESTTSSSDGGSFCILDGALALVDW